MRAEKYFLKSASSRALKLAFTTTLIRTQGSGQKRNAKRVSNMAQSLTVTPL
jgi:hypothetical protein